MAGDEALLDRQYRNSRIRRGARKIGGGALRISPVDAQSLGHASGGRVRITTSRGSAEAVVE